MTAYDQHKAVRILHKQGLSNPVAIFTSSVRADLLLPAAAALMEQESGGKNVYGHDKGGALSGYPEPVDESNYKVFRWLVANGATSNGVGPAQITFPGFFDQMESLGLSPWVVADNMYFGFGMLRSYFKQTKTWRGAGEKYNGSPEYGLELAAKVMKWKGFLTTAEVV